MRIFALQPRNRRTIGIASDFIGNAHLSRSTLRHNEQEEDEEEEEKEEEERTMREKERAVCHYANLTLD
jgi:hypothetical protein